MALDHYSFSSLSLFDTCPYAFYLEKIEGVDVADNAFAQHGSLCHKLLEEWSKGLLKKEDLPEEFENRFRAHVTASFPAFMSGGNHKAVVFEKGKKYFEQFDQFAGYKIISAEQEFETDIADRKFVGFIDLIMQDANGNAIICDHKSKSLSTFKKIEKEMYRQQYLYSKPYYEHFGEYPKYLMFNLFQENLQVMKEFKKEDYEEALKWAEDTIHKIESSGILDFLITKEKKDMYCKSICSVRNHCNK